ncbi:U-box domain-containing protein [Xylaria palmicola]|nr:U-box domain-containing protein [Xylaria palmicola]
MIVKSEPQDGEDSKCGLDHSMSTLRVVDDHPVVTIHPLESKDGVLVTVRPPVEPSGSVVDHVPCDIVLVTDVSGSMDDPAPAPASNEQGEAIKEDFGLSILDLAKHAARTIVSTLNVGDRLAIVTFSRTAEVVQGLVEMSEDRKREVNSKIDGLEADSLTDLWAGIREGLKLFGTGDNGGRVQSLMVLTDGAPNCHPGKGYMTKIRELETPPPTIHTFGFGYTIRSGLLMSISEATGGNFAFIPDPGMIGTVFVHAVAHLQTTYATRCTLDISAPEGVLLKPMGGESIDDPCPVGSKELRIPLGNLQYGQSRDIYLESVGEDVQRTPFRFAEEGTTMSGRLTYLPSQSVEHHTLVAQNLLETSPLQGSEIAYHQSRSIISEFLSGCFWLSEELEYKDKAVPRHGLLMPKPNLDSVIGRIPAKDYKDERNRSLMEDLGGQIREAISEPSYWQRWGRHYFLSLRNAHLKQLCNSFKDPGPLMYNDNGFFRQCRDALDRAFDEIPPPKPSLERRGGGGDGGLAPPSQIYSMSSYNSRCVPCFAAESRVLLASRDEVPIHALRRGTAVQTPRGARRVLALLKTSVRDCSMRRIGGALVTPWHPARTEDEDEDEDGGGRASSPWAFPEHLAPGSGESYSGTVCSVLLEADADPRAHAIRVGGGGGGGGFWGVTLGHGILGGDGECEGDVRAHPFYGNHGAVSEALAATGDGEEGVYWCGGVTRDAGGRACGFERPSAAVAAAAKPGVYPHGLYGITQGTLPQLNWTAY